MGNWERNHNDVMTFMDLDGNSKQFRFAVEDKNTGVQRSRYFDISALPLEKGEVELEDFVNNIFEILYREVRNEKGVSNKG